MVELTASLAHEIIQPISDAITNSNVCLGKLEHEHPDLEEVRATVTMFSRDANRAAEIIKRGDLEREALHVNETIRDTIILLRDEAVTYNISVRTEFADPPFPIVGDRVQLQQVVMNLVVNSI
jgi:signal transduction histidine kinase